MTDGPAGGRGGGPRPRRLLQDRPAPKRPASSWNGSCTTARDRSTRSTPTGSTRPSPLSTAASRLPGGTRHPRTRRPGGAELPARAGLARRLRRADGRRRLALLARRCGPRGPGPRRPRARPLPRSAAGRWPAPLRGHGGVSSTATGPWGRTMMRTYGLRPGLPGRRRRQPAAAATGAAGSWRTRWARCWSRPSPTPRCGDGRPTGWRSTRQAAVDGSTRRRTGAARPRHGDPRAAWARLRAGRRVMCVRRDGAAAGTCRGGLTFRDWTADAPSARPPTGRTSTTTSPRSSRRSARAATWSCA